MASSSGSLIVTIKEKAKYMTAMLYILQKKKVP
jgi:hypothetical protein